MLRGRLATFAIVLIGVSLAGAALRWFVESPANPSDRVAAGRTAERSLPLAHLALAGAGFALVFADQSSTRAGGGLLVIASGLSADLPGAFWLAGLLVGIPMLLVASIAGRLGRAEDRA